MLTDIQVGLRSTWTKESYGHQVEAFFVYPTRH